MVDDVSLITGSLLEELIQYIEGSDTIYLLVSFVMESGASLLVPHLRKAVDGGADIKVLTGDYLYVTQPRGLEALVSIDPRIEVRLWKSRGTSFHPKAYMLDDSEGAGLLVVGSSNLSASALMHGVEWNLAASLKQHGDTLERAKEAFIKMFYDERTVLLNSESIRQYAMQYEDYHRVHADLARDWMERESSHGEQGLPTETALVVETKPVYQNAIQPRIAQSEALEQLSITRDEGYDKALVVMATGLGKTYLAAMFARDFRRVLFIAHREEILFQARSAFSRVHPDKSCGVYYGHGKNPNSDFVFASIYTLAMKNHRNRFAPDDFDLIVVDEFHHAAARSYQSVIDYFRPAFLLGITATPDRADGRDVYALCDGNVAYKIDFIEAIQRKWLAPFQYYGVYDETDYSRIRWLGSRYDEEQLLTAQLRESIASRIHKAWSDHHQTRTLVFCSSIVQANFLCDYFIRQGVRAVSLNSKTSHSRTDALEGIERGELDAIFTVDLFNEGVDIPSVDTLLFVRPTESLTVFTQQIGRGLRLYSGKNQCVIVDFIGNYRNADVKMGLFHVEEAHRTQSRSFALPTVPENCRLELDTRVVDLLQEMHRKRHPRSDALRNSYLTVKQDLGRRPTYEEIHLHGIADSRGYKQEFGSWPGFLMWAGELTEQEAVAAKRYEGWFRELESTGMTKSYKMVLLLAMLERGKADWHKPMTPHDVAPFFHQYLTEKEYRARIDLNDNASRKLRQYDENAVVRMVANAPMKNWGKTSHDNVTFDGTTFRVLIDISPEDNETVFEWTRQICLYRLHTYFERKGQNEGERGANQAGLRSGVFKV